MAGSRRSLFGAAATCVRSTVLLALLCGAFAGCMSTRPTFAPDYAERTAGRDSGRSSDAAIRRKVAAPEGDDTADEGTVRQTSARSDKWPRLSFPKSAPVPLPRTDLDDDASGEKAGSPFDPAGEF